MSSFTPTVTFETTFEDDVITMDLRRLKRKSMMKLSPYMDTEGNGVIAEMELMDVATDMLPGYVTNFAGLKDANGTLIPFDKMLEEAYFIPIMSAILGKLFDISQLAKGDQGNSQGQPKTLPEAQVLSEGTLSPHARVKSGSDVSLHVPIRRTGK